MVVVMVYLVSNKSCLTLANPWTVPCQAPLSLGFPRQEYWSGLPFLSPVDLPDPGIIPEFTALQADSLPSEPPQKPRLTLRFNSISHFPAPVNIQVTKW